MAYTLRKCRRIGFGRCRVTIVRFTLLVALGSTTSAGAASSDLFDQHVIPIETAERRTVVPGFFLDSATAEIVAVYVDASANRRVELFGFDGNNWSRVLAATLPPDVLFIDVANIAGHDRLITYAHGRISWFDPGAAIARVLVDLTTRYRATIAPEIPLVDITRDLNGDGLDDLLVPDVDGFWIAVQAQDGAFSDVVKLGPPEPFAARPGVDRSGFVASSSYGETGITTFTLPLYASRVHEIDYDRDGRGDLAFWDGDHFDVYLQNARGLFDPTARRVTVDVHFDSDAPYSRAFEYSDDGLLSLFFGLRKNSRQTVLHSLRDVNGDGVGDLVTLTFAGRSILRQQTRYEVHFGAPANGGTAFAREAATAIQPRGTAAGLQPWGYASRWFEDLDGDGQIDVVLRDVAVGFGGIARASLLNSVATDLEVYRMDGGTYPEEPTIRRRVNGAPDPFGRRGFLPMVFLGDLDGDGRADLLTGRNRDELHVFHGEPTPELFSKKPRRVRIALPDDEHNCRLVDLNRDGRQDLLLYHPPDPGPHRTTVLIAR